MPRMEGSLVDAPSRDEPSAAPGPVPGGDGAPAVAPRAGRASRPPVLNGRWRTAATVGLVAVVVVGVVLRFWTRSALWLDEALTVDIARLPLHDLPVLLKRDGAPPLYYVLLHFWMKAVRHLGPGRALVVGRLSVATLPWPGSAGRRYGGRPVAWVVLALLASAPFAVYYATEARMYSLVMLLTACGFVAVRPGPAAAPARGNLVAVAVVTAALLYTPVLVALPGGHGRYLAPLAGVAGAPGGRGNGPVGPRGGGGRLPWPSCPGCPPSSSSRPTPARRGPHRRTSPPSSTRSPASPTTRPRCRPAGPTRGDCWPSVYFVLAGLALFGVARDRWHIELDIRTRPAGPRPWPSSWWSPWPSPSPGAS